MSREGNSIINETVISIFRDCDCEEGARKISARLRRTQAPPPAPLCEEWTLDCGGRWGYAFRYETGELELYRLHEEEREPRKRSLSLTSNDWDVLKKVFFDADEGKRRSGGGFSFPESFPATADVPERRVTFMVIWLTRASGSARWYYRASYSVEKEGVSEKPREYFAMDLFCSDCGVFHTVLKVPLDAWKARMAESASKFSSLFRSCREWNEVLISD